MFTRKMALPFRNFVTYFRYDEKGNTVNSIIDPLYSIIGIIYISPLRYKANKTISTYKKNHFCKYYYTYILFCKWWSYLLLSLFCILSCVKYKISSLSMKGGWFNFLVTKFITTA